MKSKSLLLILVALSTTVSIQSSSFTLSGKNVAIATFAGLIFTKVIYDYWYEPTDAQKITAAMDACEEATVFLNSLKKTYEPLLHALHIQSLTFDITQSFIKSCPSSESLDLYTFGIQIQQDIAHLISLEKKLYNTKVTIEERRNKHITIEENATRQEIIHIQNTTVDYTLALEKITLVLHEVISLQLNLQTIKKMVLLHPLYTFEYHQACLNGKRQKEPLKDLPDNCPCTYTHTESEISDDSDDSWRKHSITPTTSSESENVTPTNQNDTVWRDRFYDIGNVFNG